MVKRLIDTITKYSGPMALLLAVCAVCFLVEQKTSLGGASLYSANFQQSSPLASVVSESDIEKLVYQIKLLSQRLDKLENIYAQKPLREKTSNIGPDETDIQKSLKEFELAMASYRASLESSFAAEHRDDSWSTAAEGDINELSQTFRSKGLVDIRGECHSSMCKIVLSGVDENAMDQALAELPFQLIWQGGMKVYRTMESSGNVVNEVFLAREGYNLPRE